MEDLNMGEFKSKSRIPMKALLVLSPILPLLPFLLDYFDDHFASSMPFKLFTYSSERNYMFLFCNGILVFIIANSSAEGNSHLGSGPTVEQIKKDDNFERSTHSEIAVKFEEEKAGDGDYYIDKYPIEEEEEEEETEEVDDGIGLPNEEEEVVIEKYPIVAEEEEKETEEVDDGIGLYREDEDEEEEVAIDNKYPIVEEEETEEVVDDGIGLHNEDDDDEEEDNKQNGKDEIELLSVDELNKIFEDFIRKMRKQIDNGRT